MMLLQEMLTKTQTSGFKTKQKVTVLHFKQTALSRQFLLCLKYAPVCVCVRNSDITPALLWLWEKRRGQQQPIRKQHGEGPVCSLSGPTSRGPTGVALKPAALQSDGSLLGLPTVRVGGTKCETRTGARSAAHVHENMWPSRKDRRSYLTIFAAVRF